MGLAGEDALQRGSQFLKAVVDGGDDHGHILGCVRRLLGDGFRLVRPMAETMDNKSNIAMQP